MSRRVIYQARRRFLLSYVSIVLIGLFFLYLARSTTQVGPSSVYSKDAASSVWIYYLLFLGSQALYTIPVVMVQTKLRMSRNWTIILAALPVVYVAGYAMLIYAVRKGQFELTSLGRVAVTVLPFGAGIIPLVGILTITTITLRRLSARRSSTPSSWTTAQWARHRRESGELDVPQDVSAPPPSTGYVPPVGPVERDPDPAQGPSGQLGQSPRHAQ